MNRATYYKLMEELALDTRQRYGLTGPRVGRSELRRVYSDQGIRIDLVKRPLRKLRGAYFNDEDGISVMLAKLPDDPATFTLAHELKHHLVDSDLEVAFCDDSNENEMVEIGAEVFAAEFLFPQEDFVTLLVQSGGTQGLCTPKHIVRLKHETRTTLSHAGLAKRAVRLGFAPAARLQNIKWRTVEESIYGEPIYRRIHRPRSAQ